MTVPEALEDAERQATHREWARMAVRSQARLAHPVYGEVLRRRTPRSRLRKI